MNNTKTTLLIMSAGLGSRYGGNKQVDKLGPDGEILMQYSIYDAIRAGFNKVVFVIKPEHFELLCEISAKYAHTGTEFAFAYQDFSSIPKSYTIPHDRVKPFGTIHAVLCAKDVINEPFAVINADDFYGYDAFSVMHSALLSVNENCGAMVSYKLKNTVSKNGSVTRGVCSAEDGYLKDVIETYDITLKEDGSIIGDHGELLDGELPISMNMWGFSPEIFDRMAEKFENFLLNIEDGNIKAEYVLSHFIDSSIHSKELKIKVLSTDAEWFGVTYQADRPAVVKKLLDMKLSGAYPAKLIHP